MGLNRFSVVQKIVSEYSVNMRLVRIDHETNTRPLIGEEKNLTRYTFFFVSVTFYFVRSAIENRENASERKEF